MMRKTSRYLLLSAILSVIWSFSLWGNQALQGISYDNFGNPIETVFDDGSSNRNIYSATGDKLRSNHALQDASTASTGSIIKDYRGPVVYRHGKVYMVLFPGGYATIDRSVYFHYYTQDYLGNNRAVINGSTGAVEQSIAYYPYGGVIATLGTPTTGQPYKFGGKELVTANGLNEYDFGARQYYSAVPGFTKPYQMAGKYPWLSPYLYCANNPVNAIDPTGKDT